TEIIFDRYKLGILGPRPSCGAAAPVDGRQAGSARSAKRPSVRDCGNQTYSRSVAAGGGSDTATALESERSTLCAARSVDGADEMGDEGRDADQHASAAIGWNAGAARSH